MQKSGRRWNGTAASPRGTLTVAVAAYMAVDDVAHGGPDGKPCGQSHHFPRAQGVLRTFHHCIHDTPCPQRYAPPETHTRQQSPSHLSCKKPRCINWCHVQSSVTCWPAGTAYPHAARSISQPGNKTGARCSQTFPQTTRSGFL